MKVIKAVWINWRTERMRKKSHELWIRATKAHEAYCALDVKRRDMVQKLLDNATS